MQLMPSPVSHAGKSGDDVHHREGTEGDKQGPRQRGRPASQEGLAITQSRDDDSLTSEHGGQGGKLLITCPTEG